MRLHAKKSRRMARRRRSTISGQWEEQNEIDNPCAAGPQKNQWWTSPAGRQIATMPHVVTQFLVVVTLCLWKTRSTTTDDASAKQWNHSDCSFHLLVCISSIC